MFAGSAWSTHFKCFLPYKPIFHRVFKLNTSSVFSHINLFSTGFSNCSATIKWGGGCGGDLDAWINLVRQSTCFCWFCTFCLSPLFVCPWSSAHQKSPCCHRHSSMYGPESLWINRVPTVMDILEKSWDSVLQCPVCSLYAFNSGAPQS